MDCVQAPSALQVVYRATFPDIQGVTVVNINLAARALLLDIGEQLAVLSQESPDARWRAHFILNIESLSEVSLLLGNVYQYQAGQPEQQAALLTLIRSVIQRWAGQADHVILGGDLNASLRPRLGYSGLAHIRAADARLHAFSQEAGLTYEAPREYTWHSANESRRAVLDGFLWRSRSGQASVSHPEAVVSPDPVNDHCAVRVILREATIGELPPLEALWRPERLRLTKWKDKQDDWRTKVTQTLEAAAPEDSVCFATLDKAKRVARARDSRCDGWACARVHPPSIEQGEAAAVATAITPGCSEGYL